MPLIDVELIRDVLKRVLRHSTYSIRTTMVYVKVPVVYVSTQK